MYVPYFIIFIIIGPKSDHVLAISIEKIQAAQAAFSLS